MGEPRDEGPVIYPDLTPALVGMVMRFGQEPIACYDYDKVIAQYMADGMTDEEAVEFFEFNVIGAWVGDRTPCFIRLGAQPEEQEF